MKHVLTPCVVNIRRGPIADLLARVVANRVPFIRKF